MLDRALVQIIRDMIAHETKWLRHYTGKVVDVTDLKNKGRVKVVVNDLSLDQDGGATGDKGFWCWPRDKNSMTLPAVGDWVEVYFWNGDRDKAVYIGIANEIAGMLPKNFDGQATTHVLFEDPDNKIHAVYDALQNVLKIGNQNHKASARKDDATYSDASLDNAYWAFFDNLKTFLNGSVKTFLNQHVHQGVQTGAAISGSVVSPFTDAFPTLPSSQTGKINSGSAQVQVGDQ